jgi:hypothetical protein
MTRGLAALDTLGETRLPAMHLTKSLLIGPSTIRRIDLTPCISANDDLKIWVRKEPGGRGEEGKVQRAADY